MKKILDDFKPLHGYHCVSNSIRQILHFNGCNISEEMVVGMSSSLNFFYFEFEHSPTPMIGGRIKIGDFESNFAESLNISIKTKETKSEKKAYEELKKLIEKGQPAMIYVDMGYLDYLNLPKGYHFGGHSIVVFGIDEEQNVAFVSDRDGEGYNVTLNENEQPSDYHIVPLDELARARGSKDKPFPPANRILFFDLSNVRNADKETIFSAIEKNSSAMLFPPIKNLGLKGIKLFSEKLRSTWLKFEDDTLKYAAFDSFIMINEVGGNGGGCFRRIYGNFLRECDEIIHVDFLKRAGVEYVKIADEWDKVGNILRTVSETGDKSLLEKAASELEIIHLRENELQMRLVEFIKTYRSKEMAYQ